jgi:membrane-associated phospholipid phosphatase
VQQAICSAFPVLGCTAVLAGRVRDHFAPAAAAGVTGSDTNSLRDAIPAAALVVGAWLVSEVTDDSFANTAAHTMLEAAGFSTVTAEALKYAAGRERPDQTTDSNTWRPSGSSFPSLHTTAAFAIGTVLAFRHDRGRAALGIATGSFITHRGLERPAAA